MKQDSKVLTDLSDEPISEDEVRDAQLLAEAMDTRLAPASVSLGAQDAQALALLMYGRPNAKPQTAQRYWRYGVAVVLAAAAVLVLALGRSAHPSAIAQRRVEQAMLESQLAYLSADAPRRAATFAQLSARRVDARRVLLGQAPRLSVRATRWPRRRGRDGIATGNVEPQKVHVAGRKYRRPDARG